ncbi:MAG TPA: hypothetical protein VKP30_31560 [Polyangiaceae bacterium]|nr:hypothetical protein [Polyangiaceae bacterium]
MASKKKTETVLRGTALIKKAIEAAKSNGVIDSPEPVPAAALKKLRLPNDEKISPAMKEMLTFDASWLGWEIDEEEPEFEPLSLDELIEQELGEEFVKSFGEAIELLGEDCLLIDDGTEKKRFLYVGTPDDKGEYPVITLTNDDACQVAGFVPFDVWVAQQLGVLEEEKHVGYVPEGYEGFCKALAESNGDGRVSFKSQERDVAQDSGDEDEDSEDEDGEDEDGDDGDDTPDEK